MGGKGKMAARVRNKDWQEDQNLRDDLIKYVRQNLGRKEILGLVQIKNPIYAWSPRTLTRRLQYLTSTLRITAWILTMYAKLLRKR